MKKITLLLACFVSLSFATKKAFVVGNGDYSGTDFSNLGSAVNDAVQVTAKLKQFGYKVTTVKNGTKSTFDDSLYAFSGKLTPNDTALFFYAGHGVEYQNANYLIPSKAGIECSDNIKSRAVELDDVVTEFTSKGCQFNLFFVDACRTNYVKSCSGARGELETRGIAIQQTNVTATNTGYIFAAQPGSAAYGSTSSGGNGLFTSALLKYIGTPGDDFSELYRKVNKEVKAVSKGAQTADIEMSQLDNKFYFVPPPLTQAKQDTVVKVVTSDDRDADGLVDSVDGCPDQFGKVKYSGCLEPSHVFKANCARDDALDEQFVNKFVSYDKIEDAFLFYRKSGNSKILGSGVADNLLDAMIMAYSDISVMLTERLNNVDKSFEDVDLALNSKVRVTIKSRDPMIHYCFDELSQKFTMANRVHSIQNANLQDLVITVNSLDNLWTLNLSTNNGNVRNVTYSGIEAFNRRTQIQRLITVIKDGTGLGREGSFFCIASKERNNRIYVVVLGLN